MGKVFLKINNSPKVICFLSCLLLFFYIGEMMMTTSKGQNHMAQPCHNIRKRYRETIKLFGEALRACEY